MTDYIKHCLIVDYKESFRVELGAMACQSQNC